MSKTTGCWLAILMAIALHGCARQEVYTSLDLDLLPCEHGDSPRFFHSVEFKADGSPRYDAQIESLENRFRSGNQITDIVVFVHGWSKNPSSAESDYQNFLCRLHGKLRNSIADRKRNEGLLVIGVFWPSTITNRESEPLLLKPVSYFAIRDRADSIAKTGLYQLMLLMGRLSREERANIPIRVQLIGHSFGARMLVGTFDTMKRHGTLGEFIASTHATNVLLINAAVGPDRFQWLPSAIAKTTRRDRPPSTSGGDTFSYLFNIHSLNDSATRRLFPLASIFNDDPAACAAGGCGVPGFDSIHVDESGAPAVPEDSSNCESLQINAWNVDATEIIFGHTDVYKGRVAGLVSMLTYDDDFRASLRKPGDHPCQ